jgi:hypothetical protein
MMENSDTDLRCPHAIPVCHPTDDRRPLRVATAYKWPPIVGGVRWTDGAPIEGAYIHRLGRNGCSYGMDL